MKNFNREQMKAVYQVAEAMSFADGRIDDSEPAFVAIMFSVMGSFTGEERVQIAKEAESMEFNDAITIISKMDSDGKKYVSALLTTLMAVDGEVADKEIALLSLVRLLCQLPSFKTVGEAMDYLGV